jgi:hypothetical protein
MANGGSKMTKWQRICTITAPILVAAGLVFGFLPRNWIELRLGSDPDGGSGLVEFLLASSLVVIALAIGILAFRPRSSMPSVVGRDSELRVHE